MRWRFDWRNPSVVKVARLSGWTLGYVLANQVALFFLTALLLGFKEIGSDQSNAVSAWGLAYQFFQLPYGVFTVAIMTAFTPELARLAGRATLRAFNARFLSGLRLVLLLMLPSTVLFAELARAMVSLLLQHGRLDSGDADATAGTIAALAIGMVGFSGYLYILRGFYALKDTRTPFLINLGENAITVVLAVPLIHAYGAAGLGLAWSGGYLASAVIALVVLRRRVGPFGLRLAVATTAPVARMVVAALAMALTVGLVTRNLSVDGWAAVLPLVAGAVLGAAVYIGLLLLFKVREVREAPRLLLRGGSGS
jgi:putative peptidoglycan lipid II flippase